MDRRSSEPGFLWGVATSAYQIEGAVDADGRGRSIWDDFCREPGRVTGGACADVACDHYHRYREDVALIAALGANAYRFSIAWPRIEPAGDGREEPAGLAFYDRLIDELLAHAVVPFPTLYHWDLPSALEARGGWRERDTALRFAAYAERVVRRLGDRVPAWTTHNEPWCAAHLGHAEGVHAPGLRDRRTSLTVAHNLLRSHGLAYDAIKAVAPGAAVGLVANPMPFDTPGTDAADHAAVTLADGLQNRWYLEPLRRGAYPEDVRAHLAANGDLPDLDESELAGVAGRLDFLGVNYYNPGHVAAARSPGEGPFRVLPQRGPLTRMGWEVDPDGLTRLLLRLRADLGDVPLYVTENGVALADVPGRDGRVHDRERAAYLADHVAAMDRAVAAGADVRGYFHWSLLDNFEWQFGFSMRFGLVALGPRLERLPKDSYYAYRDLIARRRAAARNAADS
jgi:beta-glucosidase